MVKGRSADRFQVDLVGMVDLLSHHLYSGPQVYLRELLQNAVDAITARRTDVPDAPGRIRLSCSNADGIAVLEVTDTGIGLSLDEAGELLATIGRSSKREFGLGRAEFIGQFGIGMMAAFMVADQIEVVSRSARPGAVPVRWVGYADGTFELSELPGAEIEVGSRVRLAARPDAAHWLDPEAVLGLAAEYGSLLPLDVAIEVPLGAEGSRWRRITTAELPWQQPHPSAEARAAALAAYCEQVFGFTPLGHIDLAVPLAGVSGVAFILPQAVAPGSGRHRVYVKRMLLGPRVDQVLPDWAFFVRAVINSDTLSPTASREQVHANEVLLTTREALAGQLKNWALSTLDSGTTLARQFITTHHLALRALALTDDDMLDLVASVVPFETTDGPLPLAQVASLTGELLYTTTTEAYRRVAAVARGQGLVVVNAGYVYDADLLARLQRRPGWRVRELVSGDLEAVLRLPSAEREAVTATAVMAARELLAEDDCDVLLRVFEPDLVPAILLRDSEGEHRRELDREREAAPDRWSGLLDALAGQPVRRSRTLVLNDAAGVVGKLVEASGTPVFDAGLRSLYLSAVMLAGEGLRSGEVAALNSALSVLLDASLASPAAPTTTEETD
ncbi:MAG: HSP90 family protein [Propionicimonas sp.]